MVTLCLRVPYSRFFLWKLPDGLEKTGAWEGTKTNDASLPVGRRLAPLCFITLGPAQLSPL